MARSDKTLDAVFPIEGIRLGTACAGIKQRDRDDVVIIALAPGTHCAAVFTRNAFCAAPVTLARIHISQSTPRYLLINSGNANAGTGQQGLNDALTTCGWLADCAGCSVSEVLPFSTGVIGERLPMALLREAIPRAHGALAADGWRAAARAVMTTDTVPKARSCKVIAGGRSVTISGAAKGAGMIRPDMATMLAFVATDAAIEQALLESCLQHAVERSFNRITVDGDTSSNDACVLMATGANKLPLIVARSEPYGAVEQGITRVCTELAQAIVRDGEGATKFISIEVEGGKSEQECLQVAYSLAHSPLVKTAFFASDPNWGRLLAAVGRAGLRALEIDRVSIALGDLRVVHDGALAADYTEAAGQAIMAKREIPVCVHLGRGDYSATVWTCDLSYDYVRINAAYRT